VGDDAINMESTVVRRIWIGTDAAGTKDVTHVLVMEADENSIFLTILSDRFMSWNAKETGSAKDINERHDHIKLKKLLSTKFADRQIVF
jgi:hypothetical protein